MLLNGVQIRRLGEFTGNKSHRIRRRRCDRAARERSGLRSGERHGVGELTRREADGVSESGALRPVDAPVTRREQQHDVDAHDAGASPAEHNGTAAGTALSTS